MKKLLVVLLVLGLAAPAMAQTNFQFYGSLRTHIGYFHASSNYAGGPTYDDTIDSGAAAVNALRGVQDEGTVLSMGGNSQVGLRAMVSDKLMGHVEFGLRETTRRDDNTPAAKVNNPYTRIAYGQWNFGAGKLLFGKMFTPATFLGYSSMTADIGDMGDAAMLVAGLPYIGRQPQIRLSIAGFEVALIEQNTAQADLGFDDIDRKMPRIEAAYQFSTPMLTIRPILGYQVYSLQNREPAGEERTIESYLAGLGIMLRLGPAYVNMTGSWQQNAANYGNSNLLASVGRGATNFDDAQSLQGTFVAGFRFSPAFRVEAGFGYTENKVDIARNLEQKQSGCIYYLQTPITIAKGFTLIPEVGQVNRGDISNLSAQATGDYAAGRLTYVVANLKIDF